MTINFMSLEGNASAKGASTPNDLYGAMPIITNKTPMYKATQATRLTSMPIGKSLFVFLHSSTELATASNPTLSQTLQRN